MGVGISTTEVSDEDLIRSSRTGDRSSLDILYSRHHDAGLRYARRLMANRADAEDVAQDAFLRVIAAIGRGNGPEEMFRPYLLRAVRSAAADRWEEQAREIPTDAADETPVEDASLASLLHRNDPELVMKAFQSLPLRWMTVLWHAEVEREPPRRIAPILGIEPGAVSALLLRARKGLREAYLAAYAQAPPRKDCEPTFPYLAATVLGTSSTRDRRKVKEHTRECEDCAKVLAELADVGATMRGVLAPLIMLPAGAIHPGLQALQKSSSSPYGAAVAAAAITVAVGAAAMLSGLAFSGSSTPVTAAAAAPSSVDQATPVQPPVPDAGPTASVSPSGGPVTAAVAATPVQDYPTEFTGAVPGGIGYPSGRAGAQSAAAVLPDSGAATVGADPAAGSTVPQPTKTSAPALTAQPAPTPTTAPTTSPTMAPAPSPTPTPTSPSPTTNQPTTAPTPTASPKPTPTSKLPEPTPTDPASNPDCTLFFHWCRERVDIPMANSTSGLVHGRACNGGGPERRTCEAELHQA